MLALGKPKTNVHQYLRQLMGDTDVINEGLLLTFFEPCELNCAPTYHITGAMAHLCQTSTSVSAA
jgi:hypothetical protein